MYVLKIGTPTASIMFLPITIGNFHQSLPKLYANYLLIEIECLRIESMHACVKLL